MASTDTRGLTGDRARVGERGRASEREREVGGVGEQHEHHPVRGHEQRPLPARASEKDGPRRAFDVPGK